jgi:hypothetical protein
MATSNADHNRGIWLFFSALFVTLFTYPLLQVFNRTVLILGIPLLILYLLLGWLLLIGVIYRFTRRLGNRPPPQDAEHGPARDRP